MVLCTQLGGFLSGPFCSCEIRVIFPNGCGSQATAVTPAMSTYCLPSPPFSPGKCSTNGQFAAGLAMPPPPARRDPGARGQLPHGRRQGGPGGLRAPMWGPTSLTDTHTDTHTHTQTHMHTDTQTHACTHRDTRMHTNTHMHTHRDTHAHTDTHTHAHTHAQTHRDTHAHTHRHMHAHTQTHTDIHRHRHTQTCMHTQRHTHAHTDTHACTHTYIHTHGPPVEPKTSLLTWNFKMFKNIDVHELIPRQNTKTLL